MAKDIDRDLSGSDECEKKSLKVTYPCSPGGKVYRRSGGCVQAVEGSKSCHRDVQLTVNSISDLSLYIVK